MKPRPKLQHLIGTLAIIAGAVATFDNSILPAIRYLLIFASLLIIVAIVLFESFEDVDNTVTYDKIKDEQ